MGCFHSSDSEEIRIDMRLPRVSPHPYTHLAFEGCQFAKERGLGNEYHHRVFTAFFQEEQNIEDIDVLTKLAVEVGLPEAEFKDALVTRKYKENIKKQFSTHMMKRILWLFQLS